MCGNHARAATPLVSSGDLRPGGYEKIFHTPLTSIMYNNKIWM